MSAAELDEWARSHRAHMTVHDAAISALTALASAGSTALLMDGAEPLTGAAAAMLRVLSAFAGALLHHQLQSHEENSRAAAEGIELLRATTQSIRDMLPDCDDADGEAQALPASGAESREHTQQASGGTPSQSHARSTIGQQGPGEVSARQSVREFMAVMCKDSTIDALQQQAIAVLICLQDPSCADDRACGVVWLREMARLLEAALDVDEDLHGCAHVCRLDACQAPAV